MVIVKLARFGNRNGAAALLPLDILVVGIWNQLTTKQKAGRRAKRVCWALLLSRQFGRVGFNGAASSTRNSHHSRQQTTVAEDDERVS